jgi:hypothetical protein
MEYTGRIGKAEVDLDYAIVRELLEEDLLVRSVSTVGSTAPGIKSLRALHHKLAQCLAQGFTDVEASISTGYSPSRISILKADPTFKELLNYYQGKSSEIFVDVTQRMAGFATTAVEVLQERLEEKPDSFSAKDLNQLIKTTADRGGHSPVHKTENKTIVLDGKSLMEMKQAVEAKQSGQVRKINQTEEARAVQTYLQSGVQGNTESKDGANDNSSEVILEASEDKGQPWEGSDI